MSKRILSFLLCVILLVSAVPVAAQADDTTYYQIQIDAGDGVQTEKAIIEDDEIYIAASSFSKYTRFEFDETAQTFLVNGQEADKAFKKVVVNAETKKAAVGTKLIELENCFVVDGVAYLPFCQMLPMLNADIIKVDSGVIHVVNNDLSMAELLYDFDIHDYYFNISEEFMDSEWLLFSYMFPSYLFDTVVNFRFDRLDIIFDSGTSQDYQTILTGYLKDDELFHKAKSESDFAGDLLESITGLTGISGTLNDVYDWAKKIAKLEIEEDLQEYFEFEELELFIKKGYADGAFDDELSQILGVVHDDMITNDILQDAIPGGTSFADILESVDYIYSLLNQVDDHRKMLDAVYEITGNQTASGQVSGASSPYFAYDLEHAAAAQVYELYSGDIVPAYTKEMTEKIVKRLFEDRTLYNAFGVYKLTAGLTGEIVELYLPGDSGDRALLPQHSSIANSAMRKAAVPTLDTKESTNDYRLSLLLTLTASRACYEIMADTASGYGQDGAYYKAKIEKIENMIMGLYLVAENVAFDTYENYEAFAEQNKSAIKDAGLFNNTTVCPDVDNSDYLDYFYDHPEYNYYALLDINGDGVLEMLATEQEVYRGYASGCYVDVFVWKNGQISLAYDDLWPKYTALAYDSENKWLQSSTGGTGGGGYVFVYLDEDLNIQEESVEYYLEMDENFNESEHIYYNYVDITGTECEAYDRIVEKMKSGNLQDIFFQTRYNMDSEYPASYAATDLFENNGELYLTFSYCGYYVHDTWEILSLRPGDILDYYDEEVLVENIEIYPWEHNGQEMYNVWINDYTVGLMSEVTAPDQMKEIESFGDGYPRYFEIDTITLKINKNACFYDQSKNAVPSMRAQEIPYENLKQYFAEDYYGGTPISTTITVENNEIISIIQEWLS